MMTIKIGTNPIAWSNDDMQELGGNTPLETCLSEAKEAGYSGIELGHKFPREAKALQDVMQPYGLNIISGWYSSFLLERSAIEEIEKLQDHMNLLKAMGSDVIVWAECTGAIHGLKDKPLSERPTMTDDQWITFTKRLDEVAYYVASQGMKLAYHHHMGTVVETEEDIDRMMEMTSDHVGLLLDTGHISFAGGNPLNVTEKYKTRIKHFHAKDIRLDIAQAALKENKSFLNAVLDGVYTVPGDGTIDYEPLFQSIFEADYEGWVVVEAEQDPEKANPFIYAQKGYLYLETTLEKCGFKIEKGLK